MSCSSSRREVCVPRQASFARQQVTAREEPLHATEGGLALVGDHLVVRDLDRSKDFYAQLLQLGVALTTDDALLLYAGDGDHVIPQETVS